MARTTSDAVKDILGRNYDSTNEPSLTPHMDTASSVTDDLEACAIARGLTLSAAKLELIERWLSAWYYTTMDPLYRSKSTAGASGSWGERSYKDAALSLDSTGCLAGLLSGKRAEVIWLGRPPSEQTDYVDRR